MATYRVTYFYLATGMEGRADEKDCGMFDAASKDDAMDKAALAAHPVDEMYGPRNAYSTRAFFRGCLRATEVDA